MKRTTKYVGLDMHQATTVASVRDSSGRVIARAIVPTEAGALAEFFAGMRGTVRVAFEEGTQAQWLHDLLAPVVDDVNVSSLLGEQYVGFEEVDFGLFDVYFGSIWLGRFVEAKLRIFDHLGRAKRRRGGNHKGRRL